MNENPAPLRRLFQFRLRTLMIVVTLLAVPLGYVGWQVKIVRERKALAARIIQTGGYIYFVREAAEADAQHQLISFRGKYRFPPFPTMPGLRKWLGDDGVLDILLPSTAQADVVERVKELFPEADVDVKPVD